MPNALNGLITALTGVFAGLIIETTIRGFVDAGLVNLGYLVLYQLLSILAIVGLIHTTKYWGTLYLLGWWFGLYMTYSSGLVSIFEAIFDSVVLSFVLVSRLFRHIGVDGD
jgi:hypothetical protein